MGFISETIDRTAAVRLIAVSPPEGLEKAAEDRSAKIRRAMDCASKEHPDGIPPKLRKRIFSDPDAYLEEVKKPASGS